MENDRPFVISEELTKLRYEKKNGKLQKLPSNAAIKRRPINHPAIASPLAGASVQKVVYVSSNTPFMSAVKRVKKLLRHVEKRATQNVDLIRDERGDGMRKLAEASDKLAKDKEEVLVKASGRAISKALHIGEWFSNKEKDVYCQVDVRSGSISVVDDIVEAKMESEDDDGDSDEPQPGASEENSTVLEAGDTTMELFDEKPKPGSPPAIAADSNPSTDTQSSKDLNHLSKRRKRRRKRKRSTYDPDDLPEQRLRWIKTVEVAISLKS
jgi:ribonuclease P/MRP protein subunit POP7